MPQLSQSDEYRPWFEARRNQLIASGWPKKAANTYAHEEAVQRYRVGVGLDTAILGDIPAYVEGLKPNLYDKPKDADSDVAPAAVEPVSTLVVPPDPSRQPEKLPKIHELVPNAELPAVMEGDKALDPKELGRSIVWVMQVVLLPPEKRPAPPNMMALTLLRNASTKKGLDEFISKIWLRVVPAKMEATDGRTLETDGARDLTGIADRLVAAFDERLKQRMDASAGAAGPGEQG